MEVAVKWFKTFEEREAYFKAHVSSLVPISYSGQRRFWQDFTAITPQAITAYNQSKIACITAFPQDSLAFSSPQQVLRAAAMGLPNAKELENRAATMFKLENLLYQALRTLSGGETVRLALAKAWLNVNTHNSLVIASPYSWLDKNNADLTQNVVEIYLEHHKPVTFLALNDENTDINAEMPQTEMAAPELTPQYFTISAQNLSLKLSQSLSLGAPPSRAEAGSFSLELESPCLVLGENGAGKSLFVKALAKVSGYKGMLTINSGSNTAPCRLIQQNTLSQSLFRINNRFAPVSSGPLFEEYRNLYQALTQAIENYLLETVAKNSVLDVKIALAAARLCQNPKLIILDEPEWGLSFNAARAFVYALCARAHAQNVPVMLVSHKNWWQDLARSHVYIDKNAATLAPKNNIAFTMSIKAGRA